MLFVTAFALQVQSSVIVTEAWPANPKIFTVCPFTKKDC